MSKISVAILKMAVSDSLEHVRPGLIREPFSYIYMRLMHLAYLFFSRRQSRIVKPHVPPPQMAMDGNEAIVGSVVVLETTQALG